MLFYLVWLQVLKVLAAGWVFYLFLSEFTYSRQAKFLAAFAYGMNGGKSGPGKHGFLQKQKCRRPPQIRQNQIPPPLPVEIGKKTLRPCQHAPKHKNVRAQKEAAKFCLLRFLTSVANSSKTTGVWAVR